MWKDDHEPIISKETFDLAQKEKKRRKALYKNHHSEFQRMRVFTYKVRCRETGETFRHGKGSRSYNSDGKWVCYRFDCPLGYECDHKCVPDLAIRQACRRAQTEPDEVQEIVIPKDGHILLKLPDGRVYEDIFRDLYEDTPPQGRNGNIFTHKLICGVCGEYYRAAPCKRNGVRRVTWNCRVNKDNSYIHENILKRRVAEAAGWDEFSPDRFRAEVDHIDMDRPCHMVICFTDGTEKEAEYYAWDRRCGSAEKDNQDTGNEVEVHESADRAAD